MSKKSKRLKHSAKNPIKNTVKPVYNVYTPEESTKLINAGGKVNKHAGSSFDSWLKEEGLK